MASMLKITPQRVLYTNPYRGHCEIARTNLKRPASSPKTLTAVHKSLRDGYHKGNIISIPMSLAIRRLMQNGNNELISTRAYSACSYNPSIVGGTPAS